MKTAFALLKLTGRLLFGCALLSGCKDKDMAKKETLETWLERHFPNQFVVDRNLRDFQPRYFFDKKIASMVSLKEDSLVQFEVTWYKTMDDLGVTVDEIAELAERRKIETAKAREWYKVLEQGGLQRFSVGVIEQALYVFPYGEPDPATRLKYLEIVMKALDSGHGDQTSIFIECKEDSTFRQEIGEIIPFGFWRRKDTYHEDYTLVKIDFEYTPGQDAPDINNYWRVNTTSKRSLQIKDDAFPEAEKWAKRNLREPYYVERDQYVELGGDETDPLAIVYGFPIYKEKPDYENHLTYETNLGRIHVRYHYDQRKFSDIKKSDPQ